MGRDATDGIRKPRRNLNPQEIDTIREMGLRGVPTKEIAAALNLSVVTVYQRLRSNGITYRNGRLPKSHSPEEIEALRSRMVSPKFRGNFHLLKGDNLHPSANQYIIKYPQSDEMMLVSNLKEWCSLNKDVFSPGNWLTAYKCLLTIGSWKGWTAVLTNGAPKSDPSSSLGSWITDPRPTYVCIVEWKDFHGWSWREVADKIGEKPETVRRWVELGRDPRNPKPTRIIMTLIDRAAGINPDLVNDAI
ncbi:MAG: hypothetical protein WBA36_14565 [Mesorhizobium sp.]